MLGSKDRLQEELFQVGSMESLIDADHILRRVDRVLDLSWLRAEVEALYSPAMGRPSIDPEAAMRLMLAGFFHGITSDRRLMRDARVNLAIRWFAGYRLGDELPDHSSLTRIRQRWGHEVFATLFERVVGECAKAGLVDGQVIHVDATLIRANARVQARAFAQRVIEDNEEPPPGGPDDDSPPPAGPRRRVDTDAALATSDNRRLPEPSYKQHQAVDSKAGVIVDLEVTTGAVAESSRIVAQIDRISAWLGVAPAVVTADAGYGIGAVFEAFERRGIDPVIAPRPERSVTQRLPQRLFSYDQKHDIVRCRRGKALRPSRHIRKRGGRVYVSRATQCRPCALRTACVGTQGRRSVELAPGHPALLRARRRRKLRRADDLALTALHRAKIEGKHAEAKQWHGLARAARKGLEQIAIQCRLTATVLNLKRLIKATAKTAAQMRQALCPTAMISA